MKYVKPIGDKFNYSGRIDFSEPDSAVFCWTGSYLSFSFKGTEISAVIENLKYWYGRLIGFVIDGEEKCIPIPDGEAEVLLASGLSDTRHDCVLYKRMEGHYFKLKGFVLPDDGEILEPIPKPKKRIEFYGDSVTAGSVVDAVDYVGQLDPENHDGVFDNSWHSYSLMTARLLPAEVYNTAQGGIAIFDGTGYFEDPALGLESCYDKTRYCSMPPRTPWDFSKFVPHVIVFAVGQNDDHPHNGCIHDPEYREKWMKRYIEIIEDTRSHTNHATVILALTVLMHDPAWDEALEEIKNRLGGEENRVYHFTYTRCGKATPGHPRIPEQEEMAKELTAFLNSLPEDTWED